MTVLFTTLSRLPVVPPSRIPSRISRALMVCESICIRPLLASRFGDDRRGILSIRLERRYVVSKYTAAASCEESVSPTGSASALPGAPTFSSMLGVRAWGAVM